jgi:hypothetical protein
MVTSTPGTGLASGPKIETRMDDEISCARAESGTSETKTTASAKMQSRNLLFIFDVPVGCGLEINRPLNGTPRATPTK